MCNILSPCVVCEWPNIQLHYAISNLKVVNHHPSWLAAKTTMYYATVVMMYVVLTASFARVDSVIWYDHLSPII